MPNYFIVALLFSSLILRSQSFFDDFEQDNLDNWNLVQGNADLSTVIFREGTQSLRIFDANAGADGLILHNTLQNSYGRYHYSLRVDGTETQADFLFQYVDRSNYYVLSYQPEGTDDPKLLLQKVIGGDFTELYNGPAVSPAEEWIEITIERSCIGDISVTIDDLLILSVNDTEISVPGSIGIMSSGQFSFIDGISFEPDMINAEERQVMTCSGSGFAFGGVILNQDGIYRDTVETANGCDSITSISLAFVNSFIIDTTAFICIGDTVNIGSLQYTSDGMFIDSLISVFGCDSIVNADIRLLDPSVDLGPDLTICDDETLILTLSGFQSYLWSDGSTDSTLFIESADMYSVTTTSSNGCQTIDTINIIQSCSLQVAAANVFSPNGDGINDQWIPTFNQFVTDYELTIFDRFGSSVFATNDPTQSWDGSVNGRLLGTGVYVWSVTADSQTYQGDLTLLR